MTFNVTFYGSNADGKRQRIGRGTVDAESPQVALKAAHDLLGKAEPDVRARVSEIRVEQGTAGFRWSKGGKGKTAKK
jgi:hypothetical protein